MKVAYIIPQYLPSTSGDVRSTHSVAKKVVEKGDAATVFTTQAGSEEAVFSNRGILVRKKIDYVDGVQIRRHPISMKFLAPFKFLVDRNRFLKDTQEIHNYLQEYSKHMRKGLNLRDLAGFRPPVSRELYRDILQAADHNIYHVDGISLSHAVYAYKASIKNDVPLVVRPAFHFADKFYYNPTNFKILKSAAAILANTEAEADILSRLGVNPANIQVVGCGISLEQYSSSGQDMPDGQFANDDFQAVFLFLSRLQKEKGLFDVIRATIELNKKGTRAGLVIAGSDYKGNSKLVRQISEKYRFIIYAGRISEENKKSLLHACDVLAVPSIADSFGIVYLEAWACKKPVVGADIPSTRSLVSYGKDGFYTRYGDWRELLNKMKYLIDNPTERNAMGKSGYNKIVERYTEAHVLNRIYETYRCLAG